VPLNTVPAKTKSSALPAAEQRTAKLEQQARAAGGAWPSHDVYLGQGYGLWGVKNPTLVDWAYSVDPFKAQQLSHVVLNRKQEHDLSRKIEEGDDLVPVLRKGGGKPPRAWLGFASTPARELILHQLGEPLDAASRKIVDQAFEAMVRAAARTQPVAPLPSASATTATPRNYVQPNREGKRLIGAYVPIEDIPRFRALLQARGTTVQEFFAQIVQNELAAAESPHELEKLIEAQLDRFRATLRTTLKR
jgi:hypothetical protein